MSKTHLADIQTAADGIAAEGDCYAPAQMTMVGCEAPLANAL